MSRKIQMKVKADDSHIRNTFHFDVQRSVRMTVFKDRTKYSRKTKHKGREDDF